MARTLEFTFDFEEVIEGIEKGVVKQLTEADVCAITNKAVADFKKELKEEFVVTYGDMQSLKESMYSEALDKMLTKLKEELSAYKKQQIRDRVDAAVGRCHVEDYVEIAKANAEARLLKDLRTSDEDKITVNLEEYNELLLAQHTLSALEIGGVDNWEGYDFSLEQYADENQEYRLLKEGCNG